MLVVRTSLKYSPIHGLGCFAEENIKKGQIVWEFDSRFDLEFSEDELKNFSPSYLDFLKVYSYTVIKDQKKIYVLCGDHARHMNHSESPNLLEAGTVNGQNIAARDIQAGEELTCNYLDFDDDAHLKLGK